MGPVVAAAGVATLQAERLQRRRLLLPRRPRKHRRRSDRLLRKDSAACLSLGILWLKGAMAYAGWWRHRRGNRDDCG